MQLMTVKEIKTNTQPATTQEEQQAEQKRTQTRANTALSIPESSCKWLTIAAPGSQFGTQMPYTGGVRKLSHKGTRGTRTI